MFRRLEFEVCKHSQCEKAALGAEIIYPSELNVIYSETQTQTKIEARYSEIKFKVLYHLIEKVFCQVYILLTLTPVKKMCSLRSLFCKVKV